MQLGSKEEETERFNHYLKKTYKKTASLIANSCKAVSVVGLLQSLMLCMPAAVLSTIIWRRKLVLSMAVACVHIFKLTTFTLFTLSYGHPMGHITCYAHFSLLYRLPTCTEKRPRKSNVGVSVPQGKNNCASYQLKRFKVRVTGCQKPQKWHIFSVVMVAHSRCAAAASMIATGQHWQPIRDPFKLTSPAQHALHRVISLWNFLA